jgi:ketosteroid isomerase-like protein
MSQENVEALKRAFDAGNRRDLEGLLAVVHADVEWHPAIAALLEGETRTYRGHDGVREWFQDQNEAFAEVHVDYSEFRDLGERVIGMGRLRTRGKASGAETESPVAWVVEFKNGKAIHAKAYLKPSEALEAAGLRE